MKNKELRHIVTDLHCHLLPGVDDGAKTAEESLLILKHAITKGVEKIVLTPHFSYRRGFITRKDEIKDAYEVFAGICESENLPVQIFLGSEIEFSYDILRHLYNGELITMASSNCMLIEFEPLTRKRDIIDSLRQLSSFGYIPILAHAERYPDLVSDFGSIWRIKENNALVQINILSLISRMSSFCKKALKLRLVDFVATDTHSEFPPDNLYLAALKKLNSWAPPEYCENLLWANAERFVLCPSVKN